ncbi:hypothetical protein G9A89_006203 [Geosiphon pyriformis]|nr:hypothetical protein G9A89_006203 [Geosiphon pyriformis]
MTLKALFTCMKREKEGKSIKPNYLDKELIKKNQIFINNNDHHVDEKRSKFTPEKELDEKGILNLERKKFKEEEEENSPIPAVAAKQIKKNEIFHSTQTVSLKDDPTLPSITFRFWVLSTFFSALGSFLQEIYVFRTNRALFSLYFTLLGSFIIGKWMASALPTRKYRIRNCEFSLNPGPFNIKENVCIVVAASSSSSGVYPGQIIAIQELFFDRKVSWVSGILFIISTNMLGYGIAGFLRKCLVYPANMIWPENLALTSLFSSLHENVKEAKDRSRLFSIVFSIILLWQFLPQYMFPWLTSMALLCFAGNSSTTKLLGSAYRGSGILSFTLDWNTISHYNPMITPLWVSVIRIGCGLIAAWIIAPLMYYYNVLNAQSFPFRSSNTLTKDGTRYNQTLIIDSNTMFLNVTAYEEQGPVYVSTTFAMYYFYTFAAFTAAISHVALFHGKDVYQRFKASREENEDIHTKMIRKYQGIISAISSVTLSVGIISELICGYLFPGRPIANAFFTTYCVMGLYQCIVLLKHLKLGHYMKIPPRALLFSQIWGTFVATFTHLIALKMIINAERSYLDGTEYDPTGQWSGSIVQLINSATIIWGLVGPGETFGSKSIYHPLLWGFAVGVLLSKFNCYGVYCKRPKPVLGFTLQNSLVQKIQLRGISRARFWQPNSNVSNIFMLCWNDKGTKSGNFFYGLNCVILLALIVALYT